MICYLIRHGKDDDTVRGGWSNAGLTSVGIQQVNKLAKEMLKKNIDIDCIYSSDLQRAKETSEIIAEYFNVPIIYKPEFRETNNGDLAGMKNETANEKYPGLYWSTLDYSECYPNGESPEIFYNRIKNGWMKFRNEILVQSSKDVVLVTHGGVMEVILCIENGIEYSNKTKHFATLNAKLIPRRLL